MKETIFFENQTISSKIKASIVSEYFPSYCKIITSKHLPTEIRYIDLFAGPGIYEDGNPSTPILIANHCQQNEFLRQHVRMIFNDNSFHQKLKENFIQRFPEGTFKHKPHFGKSTVGNCKAITQFLCKNTHKDQRNEYPSLLFIDPFGYKGIETNVLAEFLKNWGNEVFLFVNTKRIHPALENEKFEELMNDLFPTTYQKIKQDRRLKATVSERLNLIIDSIGQEYQNHFNGKIFYTAFKFQEEDIETTSHYILHITKGAKGFDLIKTIYNDFANVGTIFDGVNTYTFDAKKFDKPVSELFDMGSMNIDKLKIELFKIYRGKIISSNELYENHHINSLYSRSHYTAALRRLVDEQKLIVEFRDNKAHKVSVLIAKDCILKFK